MPQPDLQDDDILSHELRFQYLREQGAAIAERQYAYGKWVLASLLAVNAGALLAISQAGEARAVLYAGCGPYLIFGVAGSLISGGLAWINFTAASVALNKAMHAARFQRGYELSRTLQMFISIPLYGAPAIAVLSLGAFLIAAWKAVSIL